MKLRLLHLADALKWNISLKTLIIQFNKEDLYFLSLLIWVNVITNVSTSRKYSIMEPAKDETLFMSSRRSAITEVCTKCTVKER